MEQFETAKGAAWPAANASTRQFEKYELFCHDLGRKWRMRILCTLAYGMELRYVELKSALSPVTHKMLSDELTKLADLGLINRRECGGVPVKVVYSLSAEGKELLYHFSYLAEWIDEVSA